MVIYQPQPDKLEGIKLTGRAAVSVVTKGAKEPVFGVVWLTARAQTDKDSRLVAIDQVAITNMRFPGMDADASQRMASFVEPELEHWQFTIALDRLTASLAQAAAEQRSADSLNTTPPAIIFSSVPAALLLYDGQPVLQKIDKSPVQRVVNSPMLVLLDPAASTYYLNGGPLWYSAKSGLGPWTLIQGKPPAAISSLVPDSVQSGSPPPGAPPRVIVATSPTELIVSEGEPAWSPITGTDLLQMSNTDRDVFKNLADQRTYVLLSGRWFRSASLSGPWTFVRPDVLPASFQKIPPASEKSDVRASVPGTSEATEALMDTQIPQTAAIDRKTATLAVSYDGAPTFQAVTGTSVQYATNTETKVLKIGSLYYACDQAVWFVSTAPTGPWVVSDSVPQAVQAIPPTSPVYNVKYVQVYQATPTVVYVGYTPGYTWAFPYYGTVVYGTGYVYPAYVAPAVYYPPPVTYGVAVRYNPWTGWTVGFGYTTPFLIVGVGYGPRYYGGWYGPYGRPPYPPPYYRPPYHGYPGYRPPPPGYRPPPPGYRPPPGRPYPTPYSGQGNLYGQPNNRARVAPATTVARDLPSGKPVQRPNNVVAGKDGNVYRKDGSNWQTREGNQWKNTGGAQTRPGTPPGTTTPATRPGGGAVTPGTRPGGGTTMPTTPTTRPGGGTTMPANPTPGGTTRPAPAPGAAPRPATRPAPVPSDVSGEQQARQRGQQKTQDYKAGGASRPPTSQPKPAPPKSAPKSAPKSGAAPRAGGGGRP